MRTYEISLRGKVRYAGTGADSRTMKNQLLTEAGLGPRSPEAQIEEIDIPTSKAELLAFLNALSERADPTPVESE